MVFNKLILQLGSCPVARFLHLKKINGPWFAFQYNEKTAVPQLK